MVALHILVHILDIIMEAQVCDAVHTINNGLIDGLIAEQLAVLFIAVIEFFEYTVASIVGAHTTAVAPDNCFEKERKEIFIFGVAIFVVFAVVAAIATEAAFVN